MVMLHVQFSKSKTTVKHIRHKNRVNPKNFLTNNIGRIPMTSLRPVPKAIVRRIIDFGICGLIAG